MAHYVYCKSFFLISWLISSLVGYLLTYLVGVLAVDVLHRVSKCGYLQEMHKEHFGSLI